MIEAFTALGPVQALAAAFAIVGVAFAVAWVVKGWF